uniref:Trm112 family protein n=1 Tax=Ignisphaera aggregans TaxID=334771 RepID=A0A7C5UVY9_9CREN
MKYATLNILACPICKSFPLKLYVFKGKVLTSSPSISEKTFL